LSTIDKTEDSFKNIQKRNRSIMLDEGELGEFILEFVELENKN
jgi:hypothetical protein